MKNFFIACFFIALGFNRAQAQEAFDTTIYSKQFIKLSNGQIIFADTMELIQNYSLEKLIVHGKTYKLKHRLFGPYVIYYNYKGKLNAYYRGDYTDMTKRNKNINFYSFVILSKKTDHRIHYVYSVNLNKAKKINVFHMHKDLPCSPEAKTILNKAYRSHVIAFSSLIVPGAGEINFLIFYFMGKKQMKKALRLYDPSLPREYPDLFQGRIGI